MKSNKNTSGQTLLIIVLIAAVILTVGLAVASYSITDIKISQQEEESARAFSAAEAGIEESLKIGSATDVTVGNITAQVSEVVQGGSKDFNFGGLTFASGELANVWLIEHEEDGGLNLTNPKNPFPRTGKIKACWGEKTTLDDLTPALEVSLAYKDGSDYKVIREGFDPQGETRTKGFKAVDSSSGTNCGNLAFAKNIDLASVTFPLPANAVPYLLRLKLLYNSDPQPLAVTSSTNDFPTQGKCFDSSAAIVESNITRKVRQCQFFEAPPAIFDYVLFSGGSLVK